MSQALKIQAQLLATEQLLREGLLLALPSVVKGGSLLFANSKFNSASLPHHCLPPESEILLQQALQCLAWREQLAATTEGSVGWLYISACEENASSNPHRRGPRRLAAWLLDELKSA